jgi:hypothetical protein
MTPENLFGLISLFAFLAAGVLGLVALDAQFRATRRSRPARRTKRRAFAQPR